MPTDGKRAVDRILAWAIGLTAASRIVSFLLYPLPDKTEALYAEVAREMVRTGNWVTPQLDLSPFWAKPPLSTWFTAFSFKLLGTGEFAARVPSFLIIVLMAALVYRLGKERRDGTYGLAAALVFSTSFVSYISAGAVMTDAYLALGTLLSMMGLWLCMAGEGVRARLWGYVFFAGLGLGLLAKGPVALVLAGLPTAAWLTVTRRWREAFSRLPWAGGIALALAIALPWYLMAEERTPGFLRYFFIGENFQRFLVPGWKGDMYGSAHRQPYGFIWVLWLLAALPWSLVVLAGGAASLVRRRIRFRSPGGWGWFLLAWAFAPMVFFSLAGNILWTYPLPGMPAFSLLLAGALFPETEAVAPKAATRWPGAVAMAPSAVLLAALCLWNVGLLHFHMSQRALIEAFDTLRAGRPGRLVYYRTKPPSADFYSGGQAERAGDTAALEEFFKDPGQDYFAVEQYLVKRIPEDAMGRLEPLGQYDDYLLFRERGAEERPDRVADGAPEPPAAKGGPQAVEAGASAAAKEG